MRRALAAATAAVLWAGAAQAQGPEAHDMLRIPPFTLPGATPPDAARAPLPEGRAAVRIPSLAVPGVRPVEDSEVFTHVLLEQAEGRWNGRDTNFRYDLQAWSGTDYDKLWIRSEGQVTRRGRFTDAQHDILYSRATTALFDVQAGVRVDLDDDKTRTWAALGVQAFRLYFFDLEATAYASDQGRFAGRLKASYDFLITQRLILQPEAELSFYSKADPARGNGSGLADIDAGLRLRYEITRKFAPYVGVGYIGRFGQTADFARMEGQRANSVRFVFGLRSWF